MFLKIINKKFILLNRNSKENAKKKISNKMNKI